MTDITVFPMRNLPDGSAEIAEHPFFPEFWDVAVQAEDGDLLDEAVDLATTEEAEAAVDAFLLKYPEANVSYA
ncbi:hypothetical protein [Agrobacterium pusense]|nr:hypothetical protein ShzoTeo12_55230 [Shinella zoogloeoides]